MFLTPLLIIGIALFIAYLFFNGDNKLNLKRESPSDIAKMRYAKGEITKEELDIICENIK